MTSVYITVTQKHSLSSSLSRPPADYAQDREANGDDVGVRRDLYRRAAADQGVLSTHSRVYNM